MKEKKIVERAILECNGKKELYYKYNPGFISFSTQYVLNYQVVYI